MNFSHAAILFAAFSVGNNAIAVEKTDFISQVVDLPIGSGWVPFEFGFEGEYSITAFSLKIPRTRARIRLTDSQCSGDAFQVFVNGVLRNTTNMAPFDDCATYVGDPTVAWETPDMAKTEINLTPAKEYIITIRANKSPFGGGIGYIMAESSSFR